LPPPTLAEIPEYWGPGAWLAAGWLWGAPNVGVLWGSSGTKKEDFEVQTYIYSGKNHSFK
jgi:hypothetical protein